MIVRLTFTFNFRSPQPSGKYDVTENIEESRQHGTDLSIAVNEGTREPNDDDAVQRVVNGGYEVPLTLEEINQPTYTELNETNVSGNPGDTTRLFGSCEEPIYFELDDPRCLVKPATNNANQSQESTYVEMSSILYTNVKSSFADLEQSVDNPIEGQTGKHPSHCTDAGIAQSDETRQYHNHPVVQLYANVAVFQPEQNSEDSSVHQGMDQVHQ